MFLSVYEKIVIYQFLGNNSSGAEPNAPSRFIDKSQTRDFQIVRHRS